MPKSEMTYRSLGTCGMKVSTFSIGGLNCHRFNPETPMEETIRAMDDLFGVCP